MWCGKKQAEATSGISVLFVFDRVEERKMDGNIKKGGLGWGRRKEEGRTAVVKTSPRLQFAGH